MIEFCTKRRMAFACVILIFGSIIVLVIENNFSLSHEMVESTQLPENTSSDCPGASRVDVIECEPCTSFQKKVQKSCDKTGYQVVITCHFSNNTENVVRRSCPKPIAHQEKNFWIFQTVSFTFGLVSYGVVHSRQKLLDRMLVDKINKQISSGV